MMGSRRCLLEPCMSLQALLTLISLTWACCHPPTSNPWPGAVFKLPALLLALVGLCLVVLCGCLWSCLLTVRGVPEDCHQPRTSPAWLLPSCSCSLVFRPQVGQAGFYNI